MPSLAIVIVNWNSGTHLAECLASVPRALGPSVELRRVVVVDNASSDGSAGGLDDREIPLTVVRNQTNRGFAAACNQGAAAAGPSDYLLFLNPDTRLHPGALARAVAHMEEPEHRRTGILGIQLVEADGTVARSCARLPSPGRLAAASLGLDRLAPERFRPHFMTEWDHAEDAEVDQVMGAFFLVRRPLFDALGGFDERFFVYFEEIDFSLRAREAGYRSFFCAHACADHEGGGSSRQIRGRRLFYVLRSRVQYGFKHFSRPAAAGVVAATLLLEPLARCAVALARRGPRGLSETVEGYGMLWRELPRLLRGGAGRTEG